jgi:hypothetical protein
MTGFGWNKTGTKGLRDQGLRRKTRDWEPREPNRDRENAAQGTGSGNQF